MSISPHSFAASRFSEAAAWQSVGIGWRPLHGNFRDLGFSVEWHDFTTETALDWSPSFHDRGVEICLNLAGRGEVDSGRQQLELAPLTAGFYLQNESRLTAMRAGRQQHQFITVELSFEFITRHIAPRETGLHPMLKNLFNGKATTEVSEPLRLTHEQQQLAQSLRFPPVAPVAQRMWYHAKALEVASAMLYPTRADEELFCQRHKRQNRERVQRVMAILAGNMAEPPDLAEIGRRVGCSHYYLSRIFSQETGCGIFQYLRRLRLERAAGLLREGKMNVTQVALEVGYSSPSHFSSAFHEMYGCCPGL